MSSEREEIIVGEVKTTEIKSARPTIPDEAPVKKDNPEVPNPIKIPSTEPIREPIKEPILPVRRPLVPALPTR